MKGLPPRDIQDLVQVTKVAETTIAMTYARMYPFLQQLIPADLKPPMRAEEWLQFPKPKVQPTALRAVAAPPPAVRVGIDLS